MKGLLVNAIGHRCAADRSWPLSSRRSSSLRRPRVRVGALNGRLELDTFENELLALQSTVVEEAEQLEDSDRRFCRDRWDRSTGSGFGVTRVLEGGEVLEKAAVNVSIIRGVLTPERAAAMSARGRNIDPTGQHDYSAAALSLVFHPRHPYIPTLRADIRRFTVAGVSWYGGGADLTPAYLFEDDARDFHTHWKRICDGYSAELYPEFKAWCDRYFYLPSREEHRGIGGIFFDDIDSQEAGYDVAAFVRDVGANFLPSWTAIVQRRQSLPYTYATRLLTTSERCYRERERQWQLLRRGRYIEFNLLYDRGIKFGLKGGRIESLFVSAPPLVAWNYNVIPEHGSREEHLVRTLKAPVEWARIAR